MAASEPHPELVAEQAHVDRAYDRLAVLERRALELATAERTGHAGTFAARVERDAREAAGLRRRADLRLGSLNLCFGRIDLTDGESYHLGRVAVAGEDQEPLIVDWRAPVAEPFYRATPADPLGLRRRRHVMSRGRVVLGLDDELFGPAVDGDDDLVLVGEAALLDALRQARTGRMGDIVATIQAEQDQIIRAPLQGLVVVQGGPGTGKTAVALHRTAYLLYTHRFPLEQMGVLFVGPNPVFLRYIERVLPTLGESGCRMSTVDGLVERVTPTVDEPGPAAAVKGDARMAEVVAAAVRSRQRPLRRAVTVPFGAFALQVGPRASAAIVERVAAAAGTHNARRPLVERLLLDHLARRYARAVERAQRGGLSARALEADELEESLWAVPEVRQLLHRLWPVLSPERLLVDLFASAPLLAEASTGVLADDEWPLLARTRPSADQAPVWSTADLPLLDEAAPLLGPPVLRSAPGGRRAPAAGTEDVSAMVDRVLADHIPDCPKCEAELTFTGARGAEWRCDASGCLTTWPSSAVLSPAAALLMDTLRRQIEAQARDVGPGGEPTLRTYGHVVVDEAQDLSPMQWRVLARRCPSGSMTVVGDLGQASGHWAPASWTEVVELVGSPRSSVVELTVNYRTPEEVMALAARVLAEARPDLTPARSVRQAGVVPAMVRVAAPPGSGGPGAGGDIVAATIDRVVEVAAAEAAAVTPGKVAVLAPSALVAPLRHGLTARRPELTAGADSVLEAAVSVLSVDDAKGLEFDAVVVVEPSAIAAEHPHGLGALYVALTRTTTRLAVVHAGPLPAALTAAEGTTVDPLL